MTLRQVGIVLTVTGTLFVIVGSRESRPVPNTPPHCAQLTVDSGSGEIQVGNRGHFVVFTGQSFVVNQDLVSNVRFTTSGPAAIRMGKADCGYYFNPFGNP